MLTIPDLLEGKARAEHPDYEPDLNFKNAKLETADLSLTVRSSHEDAV
jgi:hypothetical protein